MQSSELSVLFGSSVRSGTMFDILLHSAFDELVEVDMRAGTARNIYHMENKYYVPVLEGSLDDLWAYAAEHIIHPDSREDFLRLFDGETMAERMAAAQQPGLLKADIRQKLMDGRWCWVQYVIVTGRENGVEEGKHMFFVFDIQNQKDRLEGRCSSVSRFITDIDHLTGLHKGSAFFTAANRLAAARPGEHWWVVSLDIEHFRLLNAWYGKEQGDYVMARLGAALREIENEHGAAAGYFGMDDFCLLLPQDEALLRRVYAKLKELIAARSNTVGFAPVMGVYPVPEPDGRPAEIGLAMYDMALTAVRQGRHHGAREKICFFDSAAYEREQEDFRLLSGFRRALAEGELTFHLQPQCDSETGRIVGAEALARWQRADGTFLSPGRFIPVLESNGFIPDLDKHIWEQVIRWLRAAIDQGLDPVPVSVNVSPVDLFSMDVPGFLQAMLALYNVPPSLLKVEITEEGYTRDFAALQKIVARLHAAGVPVLMDDFGSGYSSLSMLSTIDVDIVKLDMAFIRQIRAGSTGRRSITLLEAIVGAARSSGMPLIVEGAETPEQLRFLSDMGCRYIQGYYFYRPMPIAEFESLLRMPEKLDHGGIRIKRNEEFHVREFLDGNSFTDTMLNNILGPAAFYRLEGGALNIVRYNEQFYRCIADDKMDSRRTCIQDFMIEEDVPALFEMLEQARREPSAGGTCLVRFHRSGGGAFWYHMHLFFLREEGGSQLFYGKVQDMTESRVRSLQFLNRQRQETDAWMRINLTRRTIRRIAPTDEISNPSCRAMDIGIALRQTAEHRIPDEAERARFLKFFSPERLEEAYRSGSFEEQITVPFRPEAGLPAVPTEFTAFLIQYLPDQDTEVYVFAKFGNRD